MLFWFNNSAKQLEKIIFIFYIMLDSFNKLIQLG